LQIPFGIICLHCRNRLNSADPNVVSRLFRGMSAGDWFVLYAMVPHMGHGAVSELLIELDRHHLVVTSGGVDRPAALSKHGRDQGAGDGVAFNDEYQKTVSSKDSPV
jgi:hypothetical protein